MASKKSAAAANTKAKLTKTESNGKTKAGKTDPVKQTTATTKTTAKAKAIPSRTKAPAKAAATSEKKATKMSVPKAAPNTTPVKKADAAASKKRKRDDDDTEVDAVPAQPKKSKAKAAVKGAVINEPPTQRLHVYVFGEGTAGELGLGTAKNAVDVKRPRLNPHLSADKVGVVQVVAGGMHVVALTHDNKILTWGVNDSGALGRDTTWEGGLKDMDAEDSDSDDEDNGLNPRESIPGEVDFSGANIPEGTRFVEVAAGDSLSLALTDDGHVYGWGTFRGNDGVFGFDAHTKTAFRPQIIPDLKKIKSIKAGANHALALDDKGSVFAWGSGQQNQLGRRVVERTKTEGLKPREFGLPKGKKSITAIETGGYHSFAISKTGEVYGWGLNNFGETGIMDNAGEDDAVILKPQVVQGLRGKTIVSIKGGGHHSLAATSEGECLIWGRIDGHQIGISAEEISRLPEDNLVKDDKGEARILKVPTKITAIEGKVVYVTTNSDHNIVITQEGKAWSWGFSANYQTGHGQIDDVLVATKIDNTATRDKILNGATTGGQFSIVTAVADV